MGNVFVAGVASALPITIHKSIIPALASPGVFGGAPWKPPSTFFYIFFYALTLYGIMWFVSYLSNMYYTLNKCKQKDGVKSALYAHITPILVFMGLFLNQTLFLPFVKSFILVGTRFIPYANHLVTGLLLFPFAFLGSFIAHGLTSKDICGDY